MHEREVSVNIYQNLNNDENTKHKDILHGDIDWDLLKHRAVILVPPDENLCDGADCLH